MRRAVALLALARDPAGWGKFGHPEWGPFRLGKTNPNFSTSGLSALIAQYWVTASQPKTTLEVPAPDVMLEVLDRWAQQRKPARVLLLVDVSGSMGDPAGDTGDTIFPIAYGADSDLGTLKRLAEATNAAAYDASDPTSITKVFTAVISNF